MESGLDESVSEAITPEIGPSSLEDLSAGRVLSAEFYWQAGHDPAAVDGKLGRARRFLRSARALYELQYQSKRPSALLKMKANSYGFKSGSTFDSLVALLSPIRGPQVLDTWTAREIRIYEDAFALHGKDFHAIASELPNKTTKDVIAFYYVWKKHGSQAVEESLSDESDIDLEYNHSSETLKFMDKLKFRQRCIKDVFTSARELQHTISVGALKHTGTDVEVFGLHRLSGVQPSIPSTSVIRHPSIIDNWTLRELRVFELAMECYGKEFHQVAKTVGTKSCKEVIALYYVWKKDPYYQIVKSRWEKRDPHKKRSSNSSVNDSSSKTK